MMCAFWGREGLQTFTASGTVLLKILSSFLHISPAGVSLWLSLLRTFYNDLEETEQFIL